MTDKELLEYAAKAAGLQVRGWIGNDCIYYDPITNHTGHGDWNPITNDGDALRLAVKLQLDVLHTDYFVRVSNRDDNRWEIELGVLDGRGAATRKAIVSAAAQIGRGME